MKWNFLKRLQTTASVLSCLSLLASPMAHGARASEIKKQEFRTFLKQAGFDNPKKTLTIGEFHRKFRHWYPSKLRPQLDAWAFEHRHELMPKVDTSIIKDKDGKEQIRMLFTKDGQSFTLTTAEDHAQIGSVKMTVKDYYDPDKFIEKVTTQDSYVKNILRKATAKGAKKRPSSIALSKREWAAMNKGQRAQYLLQLRYLVQKSDFILNDTPQKTLKKTSSIWSPAFEMIAQWTMGEPAFCKQIPQVGGRCIVAGWVATYGENLSCGGHESGRAQWNQQIQDSYSSTFPKSKACGSGFPCNPLVYGFDSGGNSYCIPNQKEQLNQATLLCNGKSPLNAPNDVENAKRIVQSWVTAQGSDVQLEFIDGKLKADQYSMIEGQLNALNAHVDDAIAACNSEDGQILRKKRPEQDQACIEIEKRKVALEKLIMVQPEGPAATDCTTIAPGACYDPAVKACLCPDGKPPVDGQCDDVLEGPVEEKKKTNWLPWIIGGIAVAGVVSCLVWWCKGDKDKKTPPGPPVDDCDIDPTLPKCQPVDPCVTNPADPSCKPPPPPPPPPPPTEGGTGTPDPDSGGVR